MLINEHDLQHFLIEIIGSFYVFSIQILNIFLFYLNFKINNHNN